MEAPTSAGLRLLTTVVVVALGTTVIVPVPVIFAVSVPTALLPTAL